MSKSELQKLSILLAVLFAGLQLTAQTTNPVQVISFEQLEPMLHQQNDTTYVFNFWATWCKPCVEEMPYLEQLNAKYKNDKLRVILVSLDNKKQLESKLIPFVAKNNIQSKVVLLDAGDPNKWIDKVDTRWSGAIPATVVYKNKERLFIEDHFEDLSSLESIVLQLTKS